MNISAAQLNEFVNELKIRRINQTKRKYKCVQSEFKFVNFIIHSQKLATLARL